LEVPRRNQELRVETPEALKVKEILVVRFRGTRGINPWNPGRYLK
jgi:hypothetical protein